MTFGFPYPPENYITFLEEFLENLKIGNVKNEDYEFFKREYDERFFDNVREFRAEYQLKPFLDTAISRFKTIYDECIKIPRGHKRYVCRTTSEYVKTIFRLGLKTGPDFFAELTELPIREDWTIVYDFIERRKGASDAVIFVDIPLALFDKLQEEELPATISALIISDIAGKIGQDKKLIMSKKIVDAIIPAELIFGAFLKDTKQFVINTAYDNKKFKNWLKAYDWEELKIPEMKKVPARV